MMKRYLLFFCLISFAHQIAFTQEKKEIAEWLVKNAVVIKDTSFSNQEDYETLGRYLSGKTIIGVGEATHGTADFQLIKYNLFKYLIQKMGFKAIAFELPNDDAQLINDFIINGKGSSIDAIEKLGYWTYHTKETQEFLEWLKEHNALLRDSDKVRVYGVDTKSSIDTESLKDSLLATQLISESSIDSLSLIPFMAKKPDSGDLREWGRLNNLVERLLQIVIDCEAKIKMFRSEHYVTSLELSLMSLKQVTNFELIPLRKQPASYRDSCLAANAIWLMSNVIPNKKLLLGMHNGHIQNTDFQSERNAAGYYLKQLLGHAYYSVGLQFARGDFSVSSYNPLLKRFGIGTVTIGRSRENSLSELFYGSGINNFYVDFNTLTDTSSVGELFNKDISMRTVECCFDIRLENSYYQNGILKELYDGMFFIETTKGTTILK